MRYDCNYGLPHNLTTLKEFKDVKYEVCTICGKKYSWRKDHAGRIDNVKYLAAHIRNFAQSFGRTKRIYHKIYKPEKCVIKINANN